MVSCNPSASSLSSLFLFHVLVVGLLAPTWLAHGVGGHQHHHNHDHQHDHHHDEQSRILQRDNTWRANGEYEKMEDWVLSEDFRSSGARCGTQSPAHGFQIAEQTYQDWLKQHPCTSEECFLQSIGRETVQVGTAWHNIQRSDGSEGIARATIDSSMQVLNNAFTDKGFQFVLESVTDSNNDAWWSALPQETAEIEMKNLLHQGGCSFMNVYSKSGGGILGWATFPFDCESNPLYDGVVIDYQTVPGGALFPYDEGDTLVHEVGHWLGLFHVFEGGCVPPGDYVADTPPEAEPDFECLLERDSCGDGGPPDSITNFMNYGPDSCLEEFTFEQTGRMHAQHSAFRFPTGTNTPAPVASPTAPTPGGSPTATPEPTAPSVCFSEVATVPLQDVGPREMPKLQIGDKVLTAHGYQTIYGFAHDNNSTKLPATTFLQIHSEGQARPLEISEEHLVFVVGQSHPIRASSIGSGDVLVNEEAGAIVTQVNTVNRNGLYAPLTPSGTILVDGILASCYVSLQQRSPEYVELQGGVSTLMSHHFLVHIWLSPVRIICLGVSFDLCQSFDNATGLAHFVQTGFCVADFMDRQHICCQLPLLMLYLVVLGPIWTVEWLLGPELVVYALLISFVCAALLTTAQINVGLSIVACKRHKKKVD